MNYIRTRCVCLIYIRNVGTFPAVPRRYFIFQASLIIPLACVREQRSFRTRRWENGARCRVVPGIWMRGEGQFASIRFTRSPRNGRRTYRRFRINRETCSRGILSRRVRGMRARFSHTTADAFSPLSYVGTDKRHANTTILIAAIHPTSACIGPRSSIFLNSV